MTPKELWAPRQDILADPSIHTSLKETIRLFDSNERGGMTLMFPEDY